MLALSGLAWSQDEETPPAFPPARPPEVLAPGVRPDVYLLRNAQGEPVVVPRVEYEEYERRMREASLGAERDLPAPTLSQLDLLIEPEGDFAKVFFDAELRLTGGNRSWLSVPLGLPQLQWLPSPSGEGRAEIVSQSNGYLWRIEPGLERARRLRLEALTRVTGSNSGNSIRLDLPSTATVVRLRLPLGDWELTASGGGSEVVEPFRTIEDHSVATIRTTANSLNLAWNRKQERQAITAVEATSLTKLSSSDDGSQIKAVTTWTLRGPTSLAGKRFAITLPANGRMRESSNTGLGFAGYRMSRRDVEAASPEKLEQPEKSDSTVPKPLILDIEVDESLGRSDLDFALDWQIVGPANPEDLVCEIPTIEGVEAHSGAMECIIPRGVLFRWTPQGDMRLVRQGPSSDGSNAMVYAFRFASQPSGIVGAWQSLVNRPGMRSSHEIEVREGSLSLQGRIEFLSDPTQLPLLQLDWSGWQAERVTILPSMLQLDRSSTQTIEEGRRWAVPLNASLFIDTPRDKPTGTLAMPGGSMPTDSENRAKASGVLAGNGAIGSPQVLYAVEYSMSQRFPPEGDSLTFSLPQVSWLNPDNQQRIARTPPGSLRLYSWPYRLRETESNLAGLIPVMSSADDTTIASTPFESKYQVSETSSETSWFGERFRRPSATMVFYEATPKISDAAIVWNHRWTCRSLGGRPNSLRIAFPKEILPREFQVDGESVEVQKGQPDALIPDPAREHFTIAIPNPVPDHSQASDFLITAISESPLSWNGATRLQVRVDLPVLQSANSKDVVVTDSAAMRQGADVEYVLADAVQRLDPEHPRWDGILNKPLTFSEQSLEVEAEWVQTILNAIYQRDRYVARFASRRNWIDVHVPSQLRKDLEIVLDGRRVVIEESPDAPDCVRINIPSSEKNESHVIEIFTLRPGPEGFVRRISLQTPRLESKRTTSSLIWQVIVPRTEHLVWNSAELSPLYRWEWRDLFLVRSSPRSQRTMEKELGATEQPEVELSQTNQYDLSALSGEEPLYAWFVPRALVWLPVAAIILLLSMSVGETSLLGRPWLWIGFLSAWIVFSQWSWDISLLVAQATLGALGLSLVYLVTRWLLNRRARRRSIFVSRSASVSNPYQSRSPSSPIAPANARDPASKVSVAPTVDAHVVEEGS
ncbi:MAG: hypothetical protein ACK5AC_05240 [Planctomycetota bacterium]